MAKKFLVAMLVFVFLPININFLAAGPVQAQTAGDTSVVIQPSTIEVTASPNQKIAKTFSIINRSNYNVILKLVVRDYKQSSENGQLQFYDSKTEPASSWLVPQYLVVGLKPLETKDVGVVINIPKNFSGGGHYGAILFQSADNSSNVNTNNFGELFLLTVTGSNIKAVASVKSANFWTGLVQQGGQVDFNFKMQNTGNTHFDANARLVLKDLAGKEVGVYNIGQLTVYPGTSRIFKWRWNNTPLLGIYNAQVMISNSAGNSSNNFKPVDGVWFVIFPWEIIAGLLLAAVLLFVAVKYRKKISVPQKARRNIQNFSRQI